MKKSKKLLVLYGPNTNLLGLQTANNINFDKFNKEIRKTAETMNLVAIIYQTNEEGKAVTKLQRSRKKIIAIILFPGPWQHTGYALLDLIVLLNIPYVTITMKKQKTIFNGIKNIIYQGLEKTVKEALKIIKKQI